ncbi:hypothetical protein [Pandoraea sp. NPDC087047]|uniref:hypothetical protein n=1 Tax=Pandoraea sp. NPDC087047 TaxID=3364390 RepID=UPI0037FC7CE3
MAVVGALIAFWGSQQARQMRTERAERIGESLKIMGNAVETFTVKYHSDIDKFLAGSGAGTLTINGVEFTREQISADRTRVANLTGESLIKALNLTGVSAEPPPGVGDYEIQVDRACENSNSCRIETLTYLTEPIKKTYSTDADLNLATVAARKIGAYGGVSVDGNFNFMGQDEGLLPIPNPSGLPGLLAMRGGSQTKDLNNIVMRDGSRGMTGDLQLKSKNATGNEVSHNIVGAGDIKGSGVLSMGSLDVGGTASIKGTLDLGAEVDGSQKNNNIVNAGDIEGSGKLSMGALNVTQSATVGSLNAQGASTIRGTLSLDNNDIDNAKSVKAKSLKATEVDADEVKGKLKSKNGIVELDKAVAEGSECTVWGIGRDNSGRIMSCQPGKRYKWEWKLSSVPTTAGEVPQPIVEQIVKENRRPGWKVWVIPLTRSDGMKSKGSFYPIYKDHNIQAYHKGKGPAPLFCARDVEALKAGGTFSGTQASLFLDPVRGGWLSRSIGAKRGPGASLRGEEWGSGNVYCLTNGQLAYHWNVWNNQGLAPRGGMYWPSNYVYEDDSPEFVAALKVIFMSQDWLL